MTTKKIFTHKIISTQTWNNNKTQLISEHKTFKNAEKSLKSCPNNGNTYHIEEII
jgi:hypothetical protein